MVGSVLATMDPRLEGPHVLGASRWTAWRRVTWPLLRPALRASALIVFLFCFTSFGVVQVLGAGQLRTLEVEIYRQTAYLLDLPAAAALSPRSCWRWWRCWPSSAIPVVRAQAMR